MKLRLISMGIILCLLLVGCRVVPVEGIQSTEGPTTTSAPMVPSQDIQPTETEPQLSELGIPVDADTMGELTELFVDPEGWYARALTSDFYEPKEINLRKLFYDGIPGENDALTEEERTYLEPYLGDLLMLDTDIIPASRIDEILQTYLGISFQDTLGVGLERFAYWEKTDCYYHCHSDTNACKVLICGAYAQEDGTIDLYYEKAWGLDGATGEPQQVAVLRPCDGGYQIVSNLPIMDLSNFHPQGVLAGDDTMGELRELFADSDGWYTRVLASDFAEPKEIDLWQVFGNGLRPGGDVLLNDEKAYLKPQWGEDAFQYHCFKFPRVQMDDILRTCLGVSLRDTLGIGLEHFTYWDETDCYYKCGADAAMFQIRIHSAYIQEDGTIDLYYERDGSFEKDVGEPKQVVVLRPTEAGYQIISNLPVADS